MGSAARWYAVRVRPRAEKMVAQSLRVKGYEEFLPLGRQRRLWSDRVKEVELPLFPGYVFSRFVADRRLPILTTPGVASIVGFGGGAPEPVDDTEIEALQVLVRSRLDLEPWPYLHVGCRVCIVAGPLAGARGILVAVRSHSRLVVSVTLLQRSVAVDVHQDHVLPESGEPRRFAMA